MFDKVKSDLQLKLPYQFYASLDANYQKSLCLNTQDEEQQAAPTWTGEKVSLCLRQCL